MLLTISPHNLTSAEATLMPVETSNNVLRQPGCADSLPCRYGHEVRVTDHIIDTDVILLTCTVDRVREKASKWLRPKPQEPKSPAYRTILAEISGLFSVLITVLQVETYLGPLWTKIFSLSLAFTLGLVILWSWNEISEYRAKFLEWKSSRNTPEPVDCFIKDLLKKRN